MTRYCRPLPSKFIFLHSSVSKRNVSCMALVISKMLLLCLPSRVLATEQASMGGLKVLNYAPGPMNTDMAREIRSAEQFEEEVQSGKLIDPRVSAEKCVRLALHGKFASGSHVDFFDED